MRLTSSALSFYATVVICNLMTMGMFAVLNMPIVPVRLAAVHAPSRHLTMRAIVGTPVRLTVPQLGINVSVASGTFDAESQTWTISDTSAYYAVESVPTNNSNGSTLIYGHARDNMFAPLKSIATGSLAYIDTDNSKRFTYKFQSVRDVDPTDTSVFTDVGPPTLVLQTCDGPWDRYRALYSFDYVGAADL